jgi:hypothetical protein
VALVFFSFSFSWGQMGCGLYRICYLPLN